MHDALRAIANPPGEPVGPGDWAKAVALLKEGKDIDYTGATGSMDFDDKGDVAGVVGHFVVDGIQFLPTPVQEPGIPIWVATMYGNTRPLRRAARHDGLFPVNLEDAEQLVDLVDLVTELRRSSGDDLTRPYDIAMALGPGADPGPFGEAGATWILVEFDPAEVTLDAVQGVLRDGPPGDR